MEYTFNLGEKEELLFDSLEEQEEEVKTVYALL